MNCRICENNKLITFLSLCHSPPANNLVKKEDFSNEESFPLELCFCKKCKLCQLSYIVPAEKMFKNYLYVSSTTKSLRIHFLEMAKTLTLKFNLDSDSIAVDIGSNDGVLLKGFKDVGIYSIGVEPAKNIAKIANENGLETINDFFNEDTVNKVIKLKGKADIITGSNVFAHIDDIKSVIRNVKTLLNDNGVFVIEIQYIVDTIEKLTFDNIYHEHLSYFSLTSLKNLFESEGMVIFDVEKVDTHGGSLRVYTQKISGRNAILNSVNDLIKYEDYIGISNLKIYREFAEKVMNTKRVIITYLRDIKERNKLISGYGAPAKATTLLNFLEIGTEYIEYIVDDNPLKIGFFTPGTHIPIVSSEFLTKRKTDYLFILAWNYAKEILEKHKRLKEEGVKFIIPIPKPVII